METLTHMLTRAIWRRGWPSSCKAQTEGGWHGGGEPSAQQAERPARPQGFHQHLVTLKPHCSPRKGLPLILNTK